MFHLAFWLFVLFLGFSYFGISVSEIVSSPAGQQNVAYVAHLGSELYQWVLMQVH